MAWFAKFGPLLSSAVKAVSDRDQNNADADALKGQAKTAQMQSFADEQSQRRENRQRMGYIAAAGAQAGGVDEGLLAQSARNAEMDALNIRYFGKQRAADLMSQRRAVKQGAGLMAGATLLRGVSEVYSRYRVPPQK